jgi:hypothetical protein
MTRVGLPDYRPWYISCQRTVPLSKHFVTLEGRLQCELDVAGLGGVRQWRAKRGYFREKKFRGRSALAGERDCKSKDSGGVETAAKFVSQLVSAGARRDKLSQSR